MTYRPLCLASVLSVALFASGGPAPAQTQEADDALLTATPEAMAWWEESRLGMFVCWGPVSLTGYEIGWSRGGRPEDAQWTPGAGMGPTPPEVYDELYKQWDPQAFDADEWVRIALETGAKYMIFLVKHHDGFCLFDTQLTDYKITGPEAAFGRDVLREIADACHKAGLKLIIYYSQPDWHHPDYATENHERYKDYFHGQIREILTNYGRIDGLWFDGLAPMMLKEMGLAFWDPEELFTMARTLQPHLVINNRCGLPGDFYTPEQVVGSFDIAHAWESCITLGTQWSWKPDDTVKSLAECIRILASCAGGGGNLALNTNPMPDGRIEPRQVERFREIGAWLRKYGESIYGTEGGPYGPGPWGAATRSGNRVYLHVFEWQEDSVTLPALGAEVRAALSLTGGTPEVTQTDSELIVRLDPADQDSIDSIIVLELDVPALGLPVITRWTQTLGGRTVLSEAGRAYASTEWGPGYEASSATDGDESTRWGASVDQFTGWLAVDLGEPMTFDQVALVQTGWNRVQRFELQYLDGEEWVTFYAGETTGDELIEFEPLTAQHVRLNVLEATNVPTILEFQVRG